MQSFKLYFRFINVYLKSKLEYRFSFFMDLFTNIFTYSLMFFSTWIIFNKFEHIQGWSFHEVIFLYNLNLFSYALSGMFIKHPMLDLEKMVQEGSFDSILVRPINPLFHMIARQFEYTFLGHIVLSIIVFWITLPNLNVVWNLFNIIWFVLFIIGAVLIHSAIMIATGSISFWTVKSTKVVEVAIYDMRSFLNYPITIYNKGIQIFLTFILPFAFINYYPAQFFLNKEDTFGHLIHFGTPITGVVLILLAYSIWRVGINQYQSTGS